MWQHLPQLHTAAIRSNSSRLLALWMYLSRCIHINESETHIHFVKREQRTHPHLLYATSGTDTALHNFLPDLTLFGANERTFAKQVGFPQAVSSNGGFHTRSDASSHSCSPPIHSSCTSMLRHSAVVPTFSAPLHLQEPSETLHIFVASISAGSIRIWAGHIKLRRTFDSPPGSWAD